MQVLCGNQLNSVSGGEGNSSLQSFDTCPDAILHFLKFRNDLFESLLSQDTKRQAQSSTMMRHYQAIAAESCSFEDIKNTGFVGIEIFLF